jgi:hypothetical protein
MRLLFFEIYKGGIWCAGNMVLSFIRISVLCKTMQKGKEKKKRLMLLPVNLIQQSFIPLFST